MGSVSSLPNGLAVLTQSGGVLSSLAAPVSASTLQSASPQDVISLSLAAVQAQQADYLFGAPQVSQSTLALPLTSSTPASGDTTATSILPGVSAADLSNATPQEKTAVNDQALQFQQAQTLFNPTLPTSPNINLYG